MSVSVTESSSSTAGEMKDQSGDIQDEEQGKTDCADPFQEEIWEAEIEFAAGRNQYSSQDADDDQHGEN